MKKKILQYLHNRFVKTETALHELKYLFWECTLKCNLNCLHCGSDCIKKPAQKDMPLDDFLNVLHQIKGKVNPKDFIVVITGGEPLLRTDLDTCGKQIRKMGFKWGIVSNGHAYDEKMHAKLMSAGMGAITISIDGLEQSHDWLRNTTGSFQKAVSALELVTAEKRLNADVVTCVNQRNFNELHELKNFLAEKKLKAWRLFTIAPIGRAKNNPELCISPGQFKSLMEFIADERKEKQMDVKFSCEGYTGRYENQVRDGFFFCRAGINIAGILADGSIGACPNLDPVFIQGNIYHDNFWDIWNNKYQMLRNRSWTKKGKCATCSQYKNCLGNGLHFQHPGHTDPTRCHYEWLKEEF